MQTTPAEMFRQAQHANWAKGVVPLYPVHGQRRGRVLVGLAGVLPNGIVDGLRETSPDIHHRIGHEHGGFDPQLPVAGNAVAMVRSQSMRLSFARYRFIFPCFGVLRLVAALPDSAFPQSGDKSPHSKI